MEDFLRSLPDDIKKKGKEVEEFQKTFQPKPQVWKNVRGIPNFNMDAAKYAYDHWTPRKGDVFVASYPKCGTTWTCAIVKQLLFIRDPNYLEIMNARGKGILGAQAAIESGPPEAKFAVADALPCSRIYFTHLPSELINVEKIKSSDAKVIYVYRNPKDALVSFFNFNQNIPCAPELSNLKTDDFNKYLEQMLQGEQWTGVPAGQWYPYHIKSWMQYKDENFIKFIAYEELKKDFKVIVRDIAEFLGLQRTDAEISGIEKRCSFKVMQDAATGSDLEKIKFFRKGGVGDWKNYFSVAQSEKMDEHIKIALGNVDIQFQYEI
uniref:sulfotransferase 6B1-like n=1 Tax=Styela clava TaxID=7725 RepID=UPI001939D6F3|nr:sulfotransferase 6B1-like [Styela clava]